MSPSSLRVLGVMTGTSCDGLDAACLEISSGVTRTLWSASATYPARLKKKVLALQKPSVRAPIRQWLELHAELGEWYGRTLAKIISETRAKPQVIANHGQTVAHFPGGPHAATLQLGEPTRIAARTGLTVVSNFREGDIAAGGQGAPLAPLFHAILAQQLDPARQGIAIHNIGGISNLTYIPPSGKPDEILAFDTGPGNIWIDAATQLATRGKMPFDRGGKIGMQGEPDPKAIARALKHRYFSLSAPKSTGRDDFPFESLLKMTRARGADLVATATWITIESIAQGYERFVLSRKKPLAAVYVCGGGAKNELLLEGLRSRLPEVDFVDLEDAGLSPQLVEAQAFAHFGFLSLLGQSLGGPWTGADDFGPPGHIIPGENWHEVLTALSRFTRAKPKRRRN